MKLKSTNMSIKSKLNLDKAGMGSTLNLDQKVKKFTKKHVTHVVTSPS